jgi:hypothetical protein
MAVSGVGNRTDTESVWIWMFLKIFSSTHAVPRVISARPRHQSPTTFTNSAASVYSAATDSTSCLLKASSNEVMTLRTASPPFAL